MKVMLLKPFILARTNGGDISVIEYLKAFLQWRWDVEVQIVLPEMSIEYWNDELKRLQLEKTSDGYKIEGLRCRVQFERGLHPHEVRCQRNYEELFETAIARYNPDHILVHYTDFFAVTSALHWNPSRTWILQTDNEFPRLERLRAFPTIYESYQQISNMIVASPFMKEKVENEFSSARAVLLPRIIEDIENSPQTSSSMDYWLFVNPVKEKGIDFIRQLAGRLPQEKFLIVGNWDRALTGVEGFGPNVAFQERQASLQSIFKCAIGLLYPSVWEEAFGRLPLEAMAMSVPVISSERGALKETVGDGGLILPLNIDLWIDAMSRVRAERQDFVVRGHQRVQRYTKERSEALHRFKELLESSVRQTKG